MIEKTEHKGALFSELDEDTFLALNKGIELEGKKAPGATFNPFADLKSMMGGEDSEK